MWNTALSVVKMRKIKSLTSGSNQHHPTEGGNKLIKPQLTVRAYQLSISIFVTNHTSLEFVIFPFKANESGGELGQLSMYPCHAQTHMMTEPRVRAGRQVFDFKS